MCAHAHQARTLLLLACAGSQRIVQFTDKKDPKPGDVVGYMQGESPKCLSLCACVCLCVCLCRGGGGTRVVRLTAAVAACRHV